MSEPNEVIEIQYKYGVWSGTAYRKSSDSLGLPEQIGYAMLRMNEEDGREVIEQTLIALLDQTRTEPLSWRCRFYSAIEWIETHVLNHRPYWLCQWIVSKTYDRCPGWVGVINTTDDEDDSATDDEDDGTVVTSWDGSDE